MIILFVDRERKFAHISGHRSKLAKTLSNPEIILESVVVRRRIPSYIHFDSSHW